MQVLDLFGKDRDHGMFDVLFFAWIYHTEQLEAVTLHEIGDKECINQPSPEGVSAKNNNKPQQSTKEAMHQMPRAVALGG